MGTPYLKYMFNSTRTCPNTMAKINVKTDQITNKRIYTSRY